MPGADRRFVSLRFKGMLKIMMSSRVGFGWLIDRVMHWGMLRLILLLIWVVVISLSCLLMLGVGYFRLIVIGILFCWICIDL